MNPVFWTTSCFIALAQLAVSSSGGASWPREAKTRSILEPNSLTNRIHANSFMPLQKECSQGCEAVGNCNIELGKCECPWPLRGPTCKINPLSMCYDSSSSPMPSCGIWSPKSCECYRQCQELYCPEVKGDCRHELGSKLGEGRCFVWRNKSLDHQTSEIPRMDVDQIDWYEVPFDRGPRAWPSGQPNEESRLPKQREWFVKETDRELVLPLHKCAGNCTGRGVCTKNLDNEQVRCVCRKGFNGTSCEQDDPEEACWFSPNCSGHGKCRSGFCHCDKGYWGMGCGRSHAYAMLPGSHAVPSRTKLRIYMYDLPSHMAFPGEFDDGLVTRDRIYTAYEYFITSFIKDWTVRTENPHEANLFFIPFLLYFYVGNVRNPQPHLMNVLNYVRTKWPFWNKTDGKDHFFWMTGDAGACWVPRAILHKPIKIVHWGLTGSNLSFRRAPHAEAPELNQDYACLLPERDIVAPAVNNLPFPRVPLTEQSSSNPGTAYLFKIIRANHGDDKLNRTLLTFFAGSFRNNDITYSGGARQALHKLLAGNTEKDVVVSEGFVENYNNMYLSSKFCISPYGAGWGLRLVISVAHACIPVIIQDHVLQPFEDVLPYHEFTVRMSVKDVPNILTILRAYSDEQINAMRLAMAEHWTAFLWDTKVGGKAYNYTLNTLRRRMHNHAAEYYRKK